jgi:hypothetical protein
MVSDFPVPSRDVTKLSLAVTSRLGTGKSLTFFNSAVYIFDKKNKNCYPGGALADLFGFKHL